MKTDAHVLGCEPGFLVVSCCSRHIRITTRTQQTLMLLIISELTQNRIWISECIYELYVYIFNPYPILVRSAYYYVAKCWRAPRTCLQSWQTTQSRDLLFMYMRCVPYNLHYWLCLSPHPKPPGRWCKMIYCTSRIEDIKNNLVHYAYSEVSSLTKSFLTFMSCQIHVSMSLYRTYYI